MFKKDSTKRPRLRMITSTEKPSKTVYKLWSEVESNNTEIAELLRVHSERGLTGSVIRLYQSWMSEEDGEALFTDYRNFLIHRQNLTQLLRDISSQNDEFLQLVQTDQDEYDEEVDEMYMEFVHKMQHISSVCELVYVSLENMFRRIHVLLKECCDEKHSRLSPLSVVFNETGNITNTEIHSFFILGMIHDAEARWQTILEAHTELNSIFLFFKRKESTRSIDLLDPKMVPKYEQYFGKWRFLIGNWRLLIRIVVYLVNTCGAHIGTLRKENKQWKGSNEINPNDSNDSNDSNDVHNIALDEDVIEPIESVE